MIIKFLVLFHNPQATGTSCSEYLKRCLVKICCCFCSKASNCVEIQQLLILSSGSDLHVSLQILKLLKLVPGIPWRDVSLQWEKITSS